MKKISLNETQKFERDCVTTHEYPFHQKNIDACFAKVTGRNPKTGFAYNMECTEVIYIISGTGEITTKEGTTKFIKDDVLMIEPMEKYFWGASCNCEMFISCNPPWTSNKYGYSED